MKPLPSHFLLAYSKGKSCAPPLCACLRCGHFTCNHYMTQLLSCDPRANEKLLELLAMTFHARVAQNWAWKSLFGHWWFERRNIQDSEDLRPCLWVVPFQDICCCKGKTSEWSPKPTPVFVQSGLVIHKYLQFILVTIGLRNAIL